MSSTDYTSSPSCGQARKAGMYTKTWTAKDACLNDVSSATVTVDIIDTTPPAIVCPSDEYLSCFSNLGNVPAINAAVDDCEGDEFQ
jgi:hypothetical protein